MLRIEALHTILKENSQIMSQTQPNNPLHGIKLKQIVEELVDYYGWEQLSRHINIRCFQNDPSVKSCLKFLRRTLWARTKVEALYLEMLEEITPRPAKHE